MTTLKYLIESRVATSGELIALKTADPKGFDTLKRWAAEEMQASGITVDLDVTK